MSREWALLFYSLDVIEYVTDRELQIIVDETGLGAGAVDRLREHGQPVFGFNGAARAFDHERFENARAEAHWHLRSLLEDGKVSLPRDAELEEEALSVEWTINARGRIQILAKDTMRAALGRSPDKLDAVVMALSLSVSDPRRQWKNVPVNWNYHVSS